MESQSEQNSVSKLDPRFQSLIPDFQSSMPNSRILTAVKEEGWGWGQQLTAVKEEGWGWGQQLTAVKEEGWGRGNTSLL